VTWQTGNILTNFRGEFYWEDYTTVQPISPASTGNSIPVADTFQFIDDNVYRFRLLSGISWMTIGSILFNFMK